MSWVGSGPGRCDHAERDARLSAGGSAARSPARRGPPGRPAPRRRGPGRGSPCRPPSRCTTARRPRSARACGRGTCRTRSTWSRAASRRGGLRAPEVAEPAALERAGRRRRARRLPRTRSSAQRRLAGQRRAARRIGAARPRGVVWLRGRKVGGRVDPAGDGPGRSRWRWAGPRRRAAVGRRSRRGRPVRGPVVGRRSRVSAA